MSFGDSFAKVYGAITSAQLGRESLALERQSMGIERQRMRLMGREVTMRENEQTDKEARAAKSAEFMQGLLDRWKVEEFDASRAMDTFLGELAVQSGFDLPAGTANKVKTAFRETYDRLIGMGIGEDQSMLHAMQETQKRYVQFGLDAVKKARGLPDFMPEPSPDDFLGPPAPPPPPPRMAFTEAGAPISPSIRAGDSARRAIPGLVRRAVLAPERALEWLSSKVHPPVVPGFVAGFLGLGEEWANAGRAFDEWAARPTPDWSHPRGWGRITGISDFLSSVKMGWARELTPEEIAVLQAGMSESEKRYDDWERKHGRVW